MVATRTSTTGCVQYELEIEIEAEQQIVWRALLEETNVWWLPDFRMIDQASIVEFDVRLGGRGLFEHRDGGGFLVWYSVQMYQPNEFKIYLVGNVAPDWGGPATSHLCLSLEKSDRGCVLRVSDAHHGRVTASYATSLQDGWNRLFGEGLRCHVESKYASRQ